MKKIIANISLTAVLSIFLLPLIASAASFSVDPLAIRTNPGKTFTLTFAVVVSSGENKNYTAGLNLEYPSDLVEVRSFSFNQGWIPLVQPGYDSIDNAEGKLIKTAGYPGGTGVKRTFGTAVFAVKKAGTGQIEVGGNSLLLDSQNTNTYTGTNVDAASLTITAAAPAPAPAPAPSPAPSPAPAPAPAPTPEPEAQAPVAQAPRVLPEIPEPEPASLLASVGYGFTLGTNSAFIGILVLLLLAGSAAFLVNSRYGHAKTKAHV